MDEKNKSECASYFLTGPKVRDLIAHVNPNPTMQELVAYMAGQTLKTLEKKKKGKTSSPKSFRTSSPKPGKTKKQTRYIRVQDRRAVWEINDSQCSFVDSKTGHRCQTRRALEIDHKVEFAKGGSNELSNLQLLCKAHNLLKAQKCFGVDRMRRYLKH